MSSTCIAVHNQGSFDSRRRNRYEQSSVMTLMLHQVATLTTEDQDKLPEGPG